MGGKAKQQQRTKNNARPSSSSRSALLIENASTSSKGFGNDAFAINTFGFASVAAEKLSLQQTEAVSANCKIVLGKLSKKDAVTKKKALQELSELLASADEQELNGVLSLWPKLYAKLSNDEDSAVREHNQRVLQLLAEKCNRKLAPYLKELMPIWLASHFDNHAPTAAVAINCFQQTFNQKSERTREVLLFCQESILSYAIDNLTAKQFSAEGNVRFTNAVEAERYRERMLVSSLKVLSFLLKHLKDKERNQQSPKATVEVEQETAEKELQLAFINLLKDDKFWALCKHKTAIVRASWYQLLHKLLQQEDCILEECKQKLVKCSFSAIDETDTRVLPHLWHCVNSLQTLYNDWHEFIDIQKALLPKLYALLLEGLQHHDKQIIEQMLHFVRQMVKALKEKNMNVQLFWQQVFKNLHMSEQQKTTGVAAVRFKEEYTANQVYFDVMQIACQELVLQKETDYLLQLLEQHLNQTAVVMLTSQQTEFVQFSEGALQFLQWLQKQDSCQGVCEKICKTYWRQLFDAIEANIEPAQCEHFVLERIVQLLQQPVSHVPDVELQQLHKKLFQLCLQHIAAAQSVDKHIALLHLLAIHSTAAAAVLSNVDKQQLDDSLNMFVALLDNAAEQAEQTCHFLLQLINLLLQQYDTTQRVCFIKEHLLRLERSQVQTFALQQLFHLSTDLEGIANLDELIIQTAHRAAKEKCELLLQSLKQCSLSKNAAGDLMLKPQTLLQLLDINTMLLTASEATALLKQTCFAFINDIYTELAVKHIEQQIRRELYLKALLLSLNASNFEKNYQQMCFEWQESILNEELLHDEQLSSSCLTLITQSINKLCQQTHGDTIEIGVLVQSISNFVKTYCRTPERMQQLLSKIFAKLTADEEKLSQDCQLMEALILQRSAFNLCENIATPQQQLECMLLNLLKFNILSTLCTEQTLTYFAEQLIRCVCITAMAASYLQHDFTLSTDTKALCQLLQQQVVAFLKQQDAAMSQRIEDALLAHVTQNKGEQLLNACRALRLLLHLPYYADFEENGSIVLLEKMVEHFQSQNSYRSYIGCLQYLLPLVPAKSISIQMQLLPSDMQFDERLALQSALYRCFIEHNCSSNYSDLLQKEAMHQVMQFILDNAAATLNQPQLLLYRLNVHAHTMAQLLPVVEYMNLLAAVVDNFALHLDVPHWDCIRIALGSWTLALAQSTQQEQEEDAINGKQRLTAKVSLLALGVYKLFAALTKFLQTERQRSSTKLIAQLDDEWQNIYANQVNASLFKSLLALQSNKQSQQFARFHTLLTLLFETLLSTESNSTIQGWLVAGKKEDQQTLLKLLLECLAHNSHRVRVSSMLLLKQLLPVFVAKDSKTLTEIESVRLEQLQNEHFLLCFEEQLNQYGDCIQPYLDDFSFKINDIEYFEPLPAKDSFAFLMLWHVIIHLLSISPESLRAIYIKWLHANKYDNTLLHFLFRCMPREVLRNYNNVKWPHHASDIFRKLDEPAIRSGNLTLELYSCHLYRQLLSQLPGLVRKCWMSSTTTRQKTFMDELTKNFISQIICNEEFDALAANKKAQDENMHMSLRKSTREISATYSIDEVRMNIVITLASNHPLGSVKVVCGKQIGGLASAQTTAMQLTLFLTHQNGNIFEGLAIWKRNLDKRFENVEQCNVCFCVVHNETCDLPKLTCKTCKKKFHSSCLFKWFKTSSKSTCPLCRHLF